MPDPAPVSNPLIDLLDAHFNKYLAERPPGAMTVRELMDARGLSLPQVKAFLQVEKEAGRVMSGRMMRSHGGGFDTVYWVKNVG